MTVDPLHYPEHTRPNGPGQLAVLDRTRACAADSRAQLSAMAPAIAAAYPDAGDAFVVLNLRTGERAVHDACKLTGGHAWPYRFGAAVSIAVAALERVRELEAQLAALMTPAPDDPGELS